MQAATKKTQKLVTREHKRIGPGQIILLFLVFRGGLMWLRYKKNVVEAIKS